MPLLPGIAMDLLLPTANMKLIVYTADANPGHIVEAGFDKFFISQSLGIAENTDNGNTAFSVYPNPITNETTITYELKSKLMPSASLIITDMMGRTISTIPVTQSKGTLALNSILSEGVYFAKMVNGNEVSGLVKLVKMK